MAKRKDVLPKVCSRCGNDLMTGQTTIHLPFEKRYLVLCGVCHRGLGFPVGLYGGKSPTAEEWKKFWDEEVKK